MAIPEGFSAVSTLAYAHGSTMDVRVCLTCGALVHDDMISTHRDWHGAISGVAIEQGELIVQVVDQLSGVRRRVQELEAGYTDQVTRTQSD